MTETPDKMTAVEIVKPGGPDVLQTCERPTPTAGPGEVLIRVIAAGVNRPDVLQREGGYPPPPGASDIPGLEVAGHVAATGAGADEFRIGDAVCALVAGGGYAEYVTVPTPQVLPIPDGLDFARSAAVPETYFTVWTNLFERGRLAAGETVLVHGGSSGIGTTAIQLARAFGARVLTTVGNDEKAAACRELGAERAINYRTENFAAIVEDVTAGQGADVILCMIGGAYLADNIDSLRPDGRLVIIALLGGAKAEVNLGKIMRGRLTVTGSTLRPRTPAEKGRIATALRAKVWPLLAAGEIGPIIHQSFPLAEAADAHALMESSAHVGKIVLTV